MTIIFRVLENIMHTKYHTPLEIYAQLAELENKYSSIAEFRSGDSLTTLALHQLKMTDQVTDTFLNLRGNLLHILK